MRVYNSDLEYIYRIRDFQARTVIRRYTGTGTVKLVFAAEDAANYYLQKNHFVVIDDEPFVVKHIEQGLEKCIIQAYSCHALLDQRITGKGENKVEQIVSVGSPDAVVKDFVNRCKGDLPITTKPNQAADFNIKEVTRLKKLGEEVQRILDLYSMGEKFTIENEVLYFDTYQGQDRTIELVFSAERGNLDELNYIESAVDDKTTIYVGGAGQGADREMVLVGDEWEGLDRIEVFRDARDVEAGDTDELINRAEKLLTSTQKAITATLVSGEYTLGDLVTVRIVRTGLDGNNADDQVTNLQLRITAETISCQDGEEHIDLQFGTIPLIDNDPVKELRSQMAQMETAEVPLERVTEQLKQDLEQTIIGQVGNLNEFANSLAGLYTTKITLPDDSKIIYSHDEPLLEDSNFIATQSAGAYAWTTTGWNDGHPAWQYGVDQTGNAIFRLISTVGLNADWIHTGRIESFDGSAWIDLDTGFFKLGQMSLGSGGFKLDVAYGQRNYLLQSNKAVDFAEQGDIPTTVQANIPEYDKNPLDLEYAVQYTIAEPLEPGVIYTISIDGDIGAWTGLWLGTNYFAGYVDNGALSFSCEAPLDSDVIIIKSFDQAATIDRVMLSQSTTRQDWLPAPEDVQALLDKKADTSSLGNMAYENLVELAKLGSTIIQGGYIKTELIQIGEDAAFEDGYDPTKLIAGGSNLLDDSERNRGGTARFYILGVRDILEPYIGQDIVISFDMVCSHKDEIRFYAYQASGISISHSAGQVSFTVSETNKWERFSLKTTVRDWGDQPGLSTGQVIWYNQTADRVVAVRRIDIRLGTVAPGDWSPSPVDINNAVAKNLGYTDYAAMMTQALAGKTIISGGLINTQLLTANNIITGKMSSANGKTYFDLDAAKILQQATVAGKDVRVEMSTAKPFSLQMKDALDRWQGYVYVTDASGYSGPNILVTSRYDINEDGVVDNEDVHILSKYMMKEDIAPGIPWPNGYPPFERMDLNSDGFVNTIDITMLIRESNHKPMIANIHNVLGIDSNGLWFSDDWGESKTAMEGSNANGSWIKYPNGMMICSKTISLGSTAIKTGPNNGFYRSALISFGAPAQIFSEAPSTTASLYNVQGQYSIQLASNPGGQPTTTYLGGQVLLCTNSVTISSGLICVMAIGRWK